jgi:DNA invertase Pin-like site-specific DNA recombinase
MVVVPAPTKPVAFIYLRVSTARQANEGVGLEAQEAKCRAQAERLGLPVAEVFRDEGISGKDGVEHRAGLAALLERVAKTPRAVVVVYSISRLARRQRLLWQLLDERDGYGLAVSSATEQFETTTPMGRAMLGMIAVFAQLEADMVSERTKDALATIRASGRKLGRKHMIDLGPEAVVTIQRVKDLYATGQYSHRALADKLNADGVPTTTGRGKWWGKTVQTALAA